MGLGNPGGIFAPAGSNGVHPKPSVSKKRLIF
jgi:hypothetical protein